MNNPLFSRLFPKIGIDFGSSRIRVCAADGSIVLDQPSCLAVNSKTKEVLAVGDQALALEGRVQDIARVYWPVQRGVVYDPNQALAFLKIILQPVLRFSFLYTPIIMVSVPANSTQVERENMTKLLYDLGAREVYTIAQPLAASIGAGVPIADSSGSFVLQLGAEVVEAAVIALGSLVAFTASDQAGRALGAQIQLTVQESLELTISRSESEQLLQSVASISPEVKRQQLVMGKSASTGSPLERSVVSQDLLPVVQHHVSLYQGVLQHLLADIPPELTIDILDKGLLLSGGLSQLHGLDRYLLQHLGMPVAVVDEPELTVIRGIHTALTHLDEYTESLGYVT